MKTIKLTLILTFIGIITLILLAQNKPIQAGTIDSVSQSKFKTTIHLQNYTEKLIIFDTPTLNLKKGDKIKFQGSPDIYKNESQIILDKISLIK